MAREVNKKKKKTSSCKVFKSQLTPPIHNISLFPIANKFGVNPDIVAIIIIALGIWVAISMISPDSTGILGKATNGLFLGLFGALGYLWCGAMIFCAGHYLVKKDTKKSEAKNFRFFYLLA